jgi:hypothetical protein
LESKQKKARRPEENHGELFWRRGKTDGRGAEKHCAHPPRRFLVPILLPAQRSQSKTATLKNKGHDNGVATWIVV